MVWGLGFWLGPSESAVVDYYNVTGPVGAGIRRRLTCTLAHPSHRRHDVLFMSRYGVNSGRMAAGIRLAGGLGAGGIVSPSHVGPASISP